MPNVTPPPDCKKRIDPIAADAIGEIDRALGALVNTQQLNLNLKKIRDDLVKIQGDNHSPGQ